MKTSHRVPACAPGAFTLIELLIVVLIIGILASIAIPNFLEAQTRARVSRAENDLRTIATSLEMYQTDWNRYPPTPLWSLPSRDFRLMRLTTPIAYMSSLPQEVFQRGDKAETYPYWSPGLNDAMKYSPIYFYLDEERERTGRWALFSRGPDLNYEMAVEEGGSGILVHYDPTNGTISNGDIMRFGP